MLATQTAKARFETTQRIQPILLMRFGLKRLTLCLALALSGFLATALLITPAHAEPHEATLKLIKQEKFNDALRSIDRYLEGHPNDPQMKFWRAFLLHKKGQTQDAMIQYREITQQYPELAEPHNNLGMLLAQQGELEEAKMEFEMALREQPDMAMAMENLSQVYLLLTEQTLKKALALNPKSHPLAKKLNDIQSYIKGLSPSANSLALPLTPNKQ
jgi:Tfp pilus assembly protein PilF